MRYLHVSLSTRYYMKLLAQRLSFAADWRIHESGRPTWSLKGLTSKYAPHQAADVCISCCWWYGLPCQWDVSVIPCMCIRKRVQFMCIQVLTSVLFCAYRNTVHRDLAARNILVHKDEHGDVQAKVADFGLSRWAGCLGRLSSWLGSWHIYISVTDICTPRCTNTRVPNHAHFLLSGWL